MVGTVAQLARSLHDALYIGPLRTVPPRGFLYQRVGRISSWADGLAAWDLISLADRPILVEHTNEWLRRLGVECQIVVQQLYDSSASAEELSNGHVDKTARRLMLDTGGGSLVLPSEVGAGVSQVIPVVVAALEGRAGFTLVEQPEIHVHPAVQVGLGDLFIQSVTQDGPRRTMLIETHSEHLILRLLRRIRETTEKELPDGAPSFSADKLSVLYVETDPDGVHIRRLRVDESGEFRIAGRRDSSQNERRNSSDVLRVRLGTFGSIDLGSGEILSRRFRSLEGPLSGGVSSALEANGVQNACVART